MDGDHEPDVIRSFGENGRIKSYIKFDRSVVPNEKEITTILQNSEKILVESFSGRLFTQKIEEIYDRAGVLTWKTIWTNPKDDGIFTEKREERFVNDMVLVSVQQLVGSKWEMKSKEQYSSVWYVDARTAMIKKMRTRNDYRNLRSYVQCLANDHENVPQENVDNCRFQLNSIVDLRSTLDFTRFANQDICVDTSKKVVWLPNGYRVDQSCLGDCDPSDMESFSCAKFRMIKEALDAALGMTKCLNTYNSGAASNFVKVLQIKRPIIHCGVDSIPENLQSEYGNLEELEEESLGFYSEKVNDRIVLTGNDPYRIPSPSMTKSDLASTLFHETLHACQTTGGSNYGGGAEHNHGNRGDLIYGCEILCSQSSFENRVAEGLSVEGCSACAVNLPRASRRALCNDFPPAEMSYYQQKAVLLDQLIENCGQASQNVSARLKCDELQNNSKIRGLIRSKCGRSFKFHKINGTTDEYASASKARECAQALLETRQSYLTLATRNAHQWTETAQTGDQNTLALQYHSQMRRDQQAAAQTSTCYGQSESRRTAECEQYMTKHHMHELFVTDLPARRQQATEKVKSDVKGYYDCVKSQFGVDLEQKKFAEPLDNEKLLAWDGYAIGLSGDLTPTCKSELQNWELACRQVRKLGVSELSGDCYSTTNAGPCCMKCNQYLPQLRGNLFQTFLEYKTQIYAAKANSYCQETSGSFPAEDEFQWITYREYGGTPRFNFTSMGDCKTQTTQKCQEVNDAYAPNLETTNKLAQYCWEARLEYDRPFYSAGYGIVVGIEGNQVVARESHAAGADERDVFLSKTTDLTAAKIKSDIYDSPMKTGSNSFQKFKLRSTGTDYYKCDDINTHKEKLKALNLAQKFQECKDRVEKFCRDSCAKKSDDDMQRRGFYEIRAGDRCETN